MKVVATGLWRNHPVMLPILHCRGGYNTILYFVRTAATTATASSSLFALPIISPERLGRHENWNARQLSL